MAELDAQIGLTADASGVEAGVGRAKKSLASLGASATKMGQDVAGAGDKAGKALSGLGDGGEKSAKKIERDTKSMQSSIQRYIATLEAGSKDSRKYWEQMADFKGVDKAALRPLLDQLDRVTANTKVAQSATSDWRAELTRLGPMMAGVFSGAALLGFGTKLVAVQREFDVLNSSLKTVTGSSAAAEREMAWLKDFAKETPFGLAQATQGFVKMKALGLDPTRASLTSFGNTASAMGKDLNQMIEAVADASTGEFERLKEFGIKAKKEGDQVSLTFQGVTTTIQNSAADITKYLENIGNTSFGGAMEERAKTLDGTIAALGDTWDELFRTVSTNNVGSLIFDSVTLANGALEDATTILRAMGGAAQDASRDTGALSTIQNGIATVFETVAVLGANLSYVLQGVGREIGGLAAQVAQAAQFNFAGVSAIREQMVADAEAARREIDATTARILNARKEQEEYARWATRNASAATDPRRVDLGGGTTRAAGGASSGAAKAAKEAISEYDKLIKKLSDEIPAASAAAEAAQMGYNKAQAEFLALAASPAWAKFTNDQRATVAALFANKISIEQSADAAKTLAKANIDAAASREKYITSLLSGLDKIKADTAAQIEATARLGLSKEAIAELDAAKLEMLATDLELQAIKAMDRNLDEQTYGALKQQAEAYRELAEAKKAGAAKEMALNLEKANQEAAREAARDWERAAADINRSLTDALLRGFESGKSFAKNLRDTIENMFSTLVLRPIISAVMTPVSGMVNGMVQGGMNAVGLGGSSNLLGMASNASSAYSLLTGGSIGAGIAGSLGSSITAIGTAIGSTAATSFGAGMAGATLAPGLMGPTTVGATGAMGAGASAGSLLSAIPGWGWALAGIGALFGGDIINGLFGRKLKDSGIEGTFGGASGFDGRQFEYYKGGLFRSDKTKYKDLDEETRAALADTFNAMRSGAKEMAGVLGLGTQAIDGFTAHVKVSLKGLSAEEADKRLKEEFDKVAESLASTTLGTQDYTRAGETAVQTLTRLSGSLTGVNQVFENLGATLYASSLAGADMASQLVDLFGGMDGLSQTAGSYMQNYYSADEQRAAMQRQLQKAFDGLNLKLPDIDASDARAQFRSLAEAQDLTTESGRKAYAALLQLSGAFAGVTQSAEDAAAAAKQLAEEQERARQDAIRSASDLLRRAIDRDRDALQDQASTLQSTIDAISSAVSDLKTNASALYGTVDASQQMLAAQGMVYIEQALAGVRAGASVADYAGLSDAIGAARSGISNGAYTSQFERERDALVLAGQLSEMAEIGDQQLTFEERQLKAINEQLEYLDRLSKLADDAVNGTAALTETVQTYFAQLMDLLDPQKGDSESVAKPGGAFAIGGSGPGEGSGGSLFDRASWVKAVVDQQLQFGEQRGEAYDDTRTLQHINAGLYGLGISQSDIANAYGVPLEDIERLFAGAGIPKFDVGTNYIQRTGLAVVHEGEAIVPKAFNPWAGGAAAGGGNAEVVAELRALRAEVAELRAAAGATASNTAGLPQMVDQFDNVTEGGNAMREVAA